MKTSNRCIERKEEAGAQQDLPPGRDATCQLLREVPCQSALPVFACHAGQIPAFVGAALVRLYAHVFTSLEYFEIFKPRDHVSTFVSEYRDDMHAGVVAVVLFRTNGARADVFNQFIGLDTAVLQGLADVIFNRFNDVHMICLRNQVSQSHTLSQPFQWHDAAEDYVLHLPDTPQQYTESLGKSTRRNIRRYHGKLLQDHPSFTLRFDVGTDIDDDQVASLLAMSEARIRSQGKTFSVDSGYAGAMTGLTRRCGFVTVAIIDGEICGGLICYRAGDGFVAKVVAHAAAFDDYWLGTLCYYFTICQAIRCGGRIFNMGTQRYDYKERLLGVRRDLDHLTIYRSRWKQVLHADVVLQMMLGRRVRQAKLWIRSCEARQPQGVGYVIVRVAMRLAALFRAVRSHLAGRH